MSTADGQAGPNGARQAVLAPLTLDGRTLHLAGRWREIGDLLGLSAAGGPIKLTLDGTRTLALDIASGSAVWSRANQPRDAPIVIVSLAAARRAPWRETISGGLWDLVVVDEAHRLKSPQSASARLVKALRARRLFLLTATPVENRLDDLFQLVNLVRPGHLGTPQAFRARHGAAQGGPPAREVAALQARMREVMVRHRRSEVALMLPRRLAEKLRVTPNEPEAELYRLVSERVREQGRGAGPTQALALRSVQRLAGSSPQAPLPTLLKVGWQDLAQHRRLPAWCHLPALRAGGTADRGGATSGDDAEPALHGQHHPRTCAGRRHQRCPAGGAVKRDPSWRSTRPPNWPRRSRIW